MNGSRVISLALVFGVVIPLSSVVSCRLFRGPQGKMVLILGDAHKDFSSIGFPNRDNLMALITFINASRLREPLTLIVEDSNLGGHVNNVMVSPALTLIYNAWSRPNKAVVLERFDPRRFSTYIVEELNATVSRHVTTHLDAQDLENYIAQSKKAPVGSEKKDEESLLRKDLSSTPTEGGTEKEKEISSSSESVSTIKEEEGSSFKPERETAQSSSSGEQEKVVAQERKIFNEVWKQYLTTRARSRKSNSMTTLTKTTVKNFLDDLEAQRDDINRLVEKYQGDPTAQILFLAGKIRYDRSFEKNREQFLKVKGDAPLFDMMGYFFLRYATDFELLTYYDQEWFAQFCGESSYLYYELMMVDKILSMAADVRPLCVYITEQNAQQVAASLTMIPGWVLCQDFSCYKVIAPFRIEIQYHLRVPELFKMAVNELLNELYHTCAHCTKKDRNLSNCAQCQTVYYCNHDCQKAAWKEHKKSCVKTQSLIKNH